MTPAPADLSRVLRLHGYESNITLPDAMRRRIASDLGIAPSELESHIQAQSAPPEPQMETIDKSLPRATRVLKACEALGRRMDEEFSEREKVEFAALLGVQRKAAMQYLRDTRAEFAETLKDAERVLADPRLKPADRVQLLRETGQMIDQLDPEPHSSEGGETSGGDISTDIYDKRAEIHTTACTQHPTHTATRCEACAKETLCLRCKTNGADNCRPCINAEIAVKLKVTEVRVRTETAAQYEAQLNRWAKDYSDAKDALERCVRDRNAAYDREQKAHSTLDDYCGEALNHTVPQRVKELIRKYDECNTAHENLMRENAALKEQARAGDLSEIVAALGLAPDVNGRDITAYITLLRESAQERDGLIEQLRAMSRENAALKEQLDDAEAQASMPSVRAVTLDANAQPLPAWYQPGMFQRQSATVFTERERVIATRLLRGQDCGSDFNGMPMDTRAAVLQLAADMAALAAAR